MKRWRSFGWAPQIGTSAIARPDRPESSHPVPQHQAAQAGPDNDHEGHARDHHDPAEAAANEVHLPQIGRQSTQLAVNVDGDARQTSARERQRLSERIGVRTRTDGAVAEGSPEEVPGRRSSQRRGRGPGPGAASERRREPAGVPADSRRPRPTLRCRATRSAARPGARTAPGRHPLLRQRSCAMSDVIAKNVPISVQRLASHPTPNPCASSIAYRTAARPAIHEGASIRRNSIAAAAATAAIHSTLSRCMSTNPPRPNSSEFEMVEQRGQRSQETPTQARRRPPRELTALHLLADLGGPLRIGEREQVGC